MAGEASDLRKGLKKGRGSTAKERISKMPPCVVGKRSSIYRGVTRHRWTGRYEAHLWDKSTWNQNQNKKGKQVYLGAYDEEEAAARAYDLAALKYWGPGTIINFPVSDYARDVEEMQSVSREEYLASLRRKSSGFSRAMSKYRGIARASQNGRWSTRFSTVIGNTCFNMVNLDTGEDAGTAYDMLQGDYISFSMATNIDLSTYIKWWQPHKMHENDALASRPVGESHSVSGEKAAHGEEQETPERSGKPCEPYQLPSLGLSHTGWHKPSPVTAGSILFQSPLFKQRLERASVREGNSGQDNNAYTDLEKVRLQEEGRSLNCQEEHKVDCKESGRSSGIYQLPVLINAAHVPCLSSIQQCNSMHS